MNGSGAAGETMLFLGPVERYERGSDGQRLRLVVPDAAALRESPGDVLDALAAANRALRTGRINYSQYRRHLTIGARGRYGDVVLANESTSAGTTANYWKGALVFAAIDRRIRVESGGEATLQDALRRAQRRAGTASGDRLNGSTFLGSVEAVAGPDARAFARRHTETNATPATWNRSEHQRVSGGLADISYRFDGFRVDGPYRNGSLAEPTVVPGETLFVRAVVRNDGDRAGNYTATLRAGDRTLGTQRGRLDPGDARTLGFRVPFETTGDPALVIGAARRKASVVPAATPRVRDLRVPDSARVGEGVRLAATVGNPADVPADGTVRAGSRRATVVVGTATPTATTTPGRTGPGGAEGTATDRGTPAPTDTARATGSTPDRPTGTAGRTDGGGSDTVTARPATAGATPTRTTTPAGTATSAGTGGTPGAGEEATPSDASGPGFGALVAVLAVLSLGIRSLRGR